MALSTISYHGFLRSFNRNSFFKVHQKVALLNSSPISRTVCIIMFDRSSDGFFNPLIYCAKRLWFIPILRATAEALISGCVRKKRDIELTFYLNDGYVMAVVYELELEDAVIEFELNIGGGDNYVDDLSLTMSAGGESFVLESSGNHAGKNGKYTDETKLYFKDSGTTMTFLTSSLSFDSKKSSDNFQWTLDMDDFASVVINIAGNMSYDSKSMTMDLNDISFTQYGEELFAFSLYYKLGEYDDKIQIDESVELLKLSENEIAAEINALGEKGQEWAMGLMDQVPELLELLN